MGKGGQGICGGGMDSVDGENGHEIVIVGGGIGGLATALALHRKGFQSVAVYERSDSLRAEGAAIGISTNGWRALDQLGVGPRLRDKAILLQGGEDIWLDQGRRQKIPFLTDEGRCVKRRDLMNALADSLPPKTVYFGYNVVAVTMDPQSMCPVLQLDDGKFIQAKVLIGCDGTNSKVANFLGLKPTRLFNLSAIRGLTTYPNGHMFPSMLVRMRRDEGHRTSVGRVPINNKLVYWFVVLSSSQLDGEFPDGPELIKQATLRILNGFPADVGEMIEGSELDSLSFTRLRYRNPWEILVGKFHKGSVTVVGDAMHVMGPFLGQGGSAALEDAVVLARNLALKCSALDQYETGKQIMSHKIIGKAFDQFVKERRMRIVRLSTQTYLNGVILGSKSSLVRFLAIIVIVIMFRDQRAHTKYDCGKL